MSPLDITRSEIAASEIVSRSTFFGLSIEPEYVETPAAVVQPTLHVKTSAELPPPSQTSRHAKLGEIIESLALSRRALTWIYVGAMALIFLAIVIVPEFESGEKNSWDRTDFYWRLGLVGGFSGLQALFLWGGGKIYLARQPVKLWKRIAPLVVFASLMVLFTLSMALTLDQIVIGIDLDIWDRPPSIAWPVTAAAWILWLVAGMFLLRKRDQRTGLARLLSTLVAGSWIEFCVAVPVELTTKESDFCYCARGSWIGMALFLPILLWAIGPALYLFYLKEKERCASDPRHARRVLQRKTERYRKSNCDGNKS